MPPATSAPTATTGPDATLTSTAITSTGPAGTAAAPPTRTRLGIGLVLLLSALTAIGPLTFDTYLAAFPEIGADLGASTAAVQLTLTASLAGLALGQLFIGSLSDAYGRRRPLLGPPGQPPVRGKP